MKNLFKISALLLTLLTSFFAVADSQKSVEQLQQRWAEINYNLEGKAQKEAFEALVIKAESITISYPNMAEAGTWQGIIKSSYAGVKGGLGALSLAKSSRKDLEKAIEIDGDAMSGSAYTSLGTLYAKVPGWPLAFGDDNKAKELLEKGLAINPNGIDSNYFYADYLAEQKHYEQAEKYFLKAQQAPARPNRPVADKGRQDEIKAALNHIHKQLKKQNSANITNRR